MTKAKKQLKAPIITAASREEAEQLLADIGHLQGRIDAAGARANARALQLQVGLLNKVKPLNDEIDAKFKALFLWAQENRSELLKGDAKSVELATGVLSWRWTPPSVQIARGKNSEVIQNLLDDDQTCEHFVRTSYEINKQAILDAAAGDDKKLRELVEGMEHITIKRTEEFAAKPTDIAQEYIETVKPVKTEKRGDK